MGSTLPSLRASFHAASIAARKEWPHGWHMETALLEAASTVQVS